MSVGKAEDLARPGDIIAGKYRVERVLGAGGMGVVVLAHHLQLDEKVALKFLLPGALKSAEAVSRFVREARAAAKIKSAHVARVSDVGELEGGSPYMVMEYLEGTDLSEWLAQHGPLPIDQAVDFVLQASEALGEAHGLGIVHRDLKPANLFCARGADGHFVIKVLDFGISKVTTPGAEGHDMTRTTALLGSPLYMSPEQMRHSKGVDSRTDIWALGTILFELLAGRAPFLADSITELAIRVANEPPAPLVASRPDVPPQLQAVLEKCLAKNREDRYADVGQLALALAPFGSRRARVSVERILDTLRTSGVAQSASPAMTDDAFAPTAMGDSLVAPTTAASWGQTKAPPVPEKTKPLKVVASVAIAAVVLLAGAAGVLRQGGTASARADLTHLTSEGPSALAVLPPAPIASATAPSAPSAAYAPVTAPVSQPPASAVPTAATISVPRASLPARSVPARVAAPPTAPSVASPRPTAATATPTNCDVPFTFDSNGRHVPKPECL